MCDSPTAMWEFGQKTNMCARVQRIVLYPVLSKNALDSTGQPIDRYVTCILYTGTYCVLYPDLSRNVLDSTGQPRDRYVTCILYTAHNILYTGTYCVLYPVSCTRERTG